MKSECAARAADRAQSCNTRAGSGAASWRSCCGALRAASARLPARWWSIATSRSSSRSSSASNGARSPPDALVTPALHRASKPRPPGGSKRNRDGTAVPFTGALADYTPPPSTGRALAAALHSSRLERRGPRARAGAMCAGRHVSRAVRSIFGIIGDPSTDIPRSLDGCYLRSTQPLAPPTVRARQERAPTLTAKRPARRPPGQAAGHGAAAVRHQQGSAVPRADRSRLRHVRQAAGGHRHRPQLAEVRRAAGARGGCCRHGAGMLTIRPQRDKLKGQLRVLQGERAAATPQGAAPAAVPAAAPAAAAEPQHDEKRRRVEGGAQ
jgi:hypothetical protein